VDGVEKPRLGRHVETSFSTPNERADTHDPLNRSKPINQEQHDDDDHDDTDDTDTAVPITVTITAKTAAEAAEQQDDKDDE
jgi:hypothetical protein